MTRSIKHLRPITTRWLSIAGSVALLCGLGTAPAAEEGYLPAPVQKLQLILKADAKTPGDLKERGEALDKIAIELPNADLRPALALDSWKDLDKVEAVAAVDGPVRAKLVTRFTEWLTGILDKTGPENNGAKLAAVTMLGEMGINVRGTGEKKMPLAARLTPSLVRLLNDPDPRLRQAAARALGKILPGESKGDKAEGWDPEPVTAALGKLLQSKNAADREAAADGLATMLRTLLPVGVSKSSAQTVDITKAESLKLGTLVVQEAGKGLADSDPLVRRDCLEALQTGAALLGELGEVVARDLPPPGRPATEDERAKLKQYYADIQAAVKEVKPLADALSASAKGVAQNLNDMAAPTVRLRAAQVLMEMGYARQKLLPKDATIPAPGRVPMPAPEKSTQRRSNGIQIADARRFALAQADKPEQVDDPLKPGLEEAVPSLAKRLQDPEPQVRLAALEALITLGPLAKGALPAATQTLNDSNNFVRWAAVRLLGKIGAPDDAGQRQAAVAGLATALNDTDLDVRKAATTALGIYGQAAAAALPTLSQHVEFGNPRIRDYVLNWPPAFGKVRSSAEYFDADLRQAQIRTVQADVSDATAASAVRALAAALTDTDQRVRRAAAEALAQFGPLAKPAVPALQKALDDPEGDVRRAAADALLAVSAGK